MSTPPPLILGSTSPYRRELLARLGLEFDTCSPNVDETRQAGESPADLVQRLSLAKAQSVADQLGKGLIIGSDQVAVLGSRVLGKPGNREHNIAQLAAASGQQVHFLTGLCLLDAESDEYRLGLVPFEVRFRPLTSTEIEHYVDRERPFDCAGGFKSEGLGIALFAAMQGEDPSALMGLPLIRLVDFLAQFGRPVL